jgi:hypothetical protein
MIQELYIAYSYKSESCAAANICAVQSIGILRLTFITKSLAQTIS